MAYIIGLLDDDDRKTLESRGWDIEPAPTELIPETIPLEDRKRMAMVWVDANMFWVCRYSSCDGL